MAAKLLYQAGRGNLLRRAHAITGEEIESRPLSSYDVALSWTGT